MLIRVLPVAGAEHLKKQLPRLPWPLVYFTASWIFAVKAFPAHVTSRQHASVGFRHAIYNIEPRYVSAEEVFELLG